MQFEKVFMQSYLRNILPSIGPLGNGRHSLSFNKMHSDKAEKAAICQGASQFLHLAKSDLAAWTCFVGHGVVNSLACKVTYTPPSLFNCLFNIKGNVAKQRLWLE